MADPARRLDTNVDGRFYVDESCIDCGACRWIAPEVFDSAGEASRVHCQPTTPLQLDAALGALVACPTASIGTEGDDDVRGAAASYPRRWTGPVRHCGFHAESSFGATSWLLERPEGNILIDSPRFSRSLADRIEARGEVALIFLTHRDDVADHARWTERLGAERVMHLEDRTEGTRDVEHFIEGLDPVDLGGGTRVLPTPGHTRGSACLLHRDRWLFSGDHLAWRLSESRLVAFRRACWFDWSVQIESMERLTAERFEWVLPGHGAPKGLEADRMAGELARCLQWMREVA